MALALSREAHARGRELFAAHAFERSIISPSFTAFPNGTKGDGRGGGVHVYASGRRRLARGAESGRDAVTHYIVRERFEDAALVELELETGRQHQIRLHMQSLGHLLVGEKVYGGAAGRRGRCCTHGETLAFPHPLHGTTIRVEAQLPDDFTRVLRSLRARHAPHGDMVGRGAACRRDAGRVRRRAIAVA